MTALEAGPHPILVHRLRGLLGRATVWVAPNGPPHADPERWLDWQRRSRVSLPLTLGLSENNERVLVCFTSSDAHRVLPKVSQPAWTIPLRFADAAAQAAQLGADLMVLDPGNRPSVIIRRPVFAPQAAPEDGGAVIAS